MDNYFARQELVIDNETGLKIKQARILVIGAGAGGNEVLKNLALMGFGNFTIVDFDPIESSNLSRTTLFTKEDIGRSKAEVAAAALRKVSLHEAPNITAINEKIQDIGKQIFIDNDLVVCCVDTANARAYISDWCVRLKKPFFEMGFEKFVIQVSFFPNQATTDSCLREFIGAGEFTGKRQSCSKLKVNDTSLQHIPTIQVAAAFAGVFVATEIILFLQDKSRLKNKMLQYAAEYHLCQVIEAPQSEKCVLHKDNELSIIESGLSNEVTINDLLVHVKNAVNEECFLRLEDEFIIAMDCEECGKEIGINKFKSDVYDQERWCEQCFVPEQYKETPVSRNWKIIRELNLVNKKHADFLQMKLSAFSVKANDLVRLDSLNDLSKSFLLKINERT